MNHAAGFYNFYHLIKQFVLRVTHPVATKNHRVHTEWHRPLSGVHSTMMEKWDVHAHPLSLFLPSRTKLQCRQACTGDTVLDKSREMTGRSQILP